MEVWPGSWEGLRTRPRARRTQKGPAVAREPLISGARLENPARLRMPYQVLETPMPKVRGSV